MWVKAEVKALGAMMWWAKYNFLAGRKTSSITSRGNKSVHGTWHQAAFAYKDTATTLARIIYNLCIFSPNKDQQHTHPAYKRKHNEGGFAWLNPFWDFKQRATFQLDGLGQVTISGSNLPPRIIAWLRAKLNITLKVNMPPTAETFNPAPSFVHLQ